MDAADYSVGDYGRTHGTGCHLVHGYVDKERKPTGFRLSFVEMTGEESQNLPFDSQNLQTTLKIYKITLKIYKNVSYLQFPIASMVIFSYICTTTQYIMFKLITR